jgi:hypothetical protein
MPMDTVLHPYFVRVRGWSAPQRLQVHPGKVELRKVSWRVARIVGEEERVVFT